MKLIPVFSMQRSVHILFRDVKAKHRKWGFFFFLKEQKDVGHKQDMDIIVWQ